MPRFSTFIRYLTLILNFFIRIHFGQHGEDVIIRKLFDRKFNKGFYIDVGAYHPFRHSNTAYFWLKGWRGVNIDANEKAIKLFKKIRFNDVNIWTAIVDIETAKNHKRVKLMSNPSVKFDLGATCHPDEVNSRSQTQTLETEVPCEALKNVINKYAPEKSKNFQLLSIDIEGFDEVAVSDINHWKVKPQVICIEILQAKTIDEMISTKTNHYLKQAGYSLIGKSGSSAIYLINKVS